LKATRTTIITAPIIIYFFNLSSPALGG